MTAQRGFTVVSEEDDERDERPAAPSTAAAAGGSMLMLGLSALAQRTVIALANLFCLLTVGSVFWLFMSVMPAPTVLQLVGLGMYAVFIGVSNVIVRRR